MNTHPREHDASLTDGFAEELPRHSLKSIKDSIRAAVAKKGLAMRMTSAGFVRVPKKRLA